MHAYASLQAGNPGILAASAPSDECTIRTDIPCCPGQTFFPLCLFFPASYPSSPTPIHCLFAGTAVWLETGWINQQTGASLCCFCLILYGAGLCTVLLSLPFCSLIFRGQQQCKLLGKWHRNLAQMLFKQADLWIPHQGKCHKVSFFPLTFKFKMAFPLSLPSLHPAWCDGAWRALRFWGKRLWQDMKQWMMILARERSSVLNCRFNPRTNMRGQILLYYWLLLCCPSASWLKFVFFFYVLWSVAVEPPYLLEISHSAPARLYCSFSPQSLQIKKWGWQGN